MNNQELLNELVKSSTVYLESFKVGQMDAIPSPPLSLQQAIKNIKVSDFGKDFKSTFTFKELEELDLNSSPTIIEVASEYEKYNDATKVSVALYASKVYLKGNFAVQIDYLLTVITEKPDKNDMIWKTSITK